MVTNNVKREARYIPKTNAAPMIASNQCWTTVGILSEISANSG